MPELQITQEYLGFSNHLVFLVPMWREFFDSDTYAKGPGSTVTKVADGSLMQAAPDWRPRAWPTPDRIGTGAAINSLSGQLVRLRSSGLEPGPRSRQIAEDGSG